MKRWIAVLTALLLIVLPAPTLLAQAITPEVPAVPAAPTPPPQASGIVGLVQMLAGACKACKAKMCACPLGELITNATQPLNALAGGLLCPPCCPPISPDDLKKPSTSTQGACAKITKDTMEAQARVKSVRCLAYVDCHWWPEAEAALIVALRTDKNECVRLAAAQALLNGCCCTKKTIETLVTVVNKSERDSNPAENSERVIQTALLALQNCLIRYHEPTPTPREQPEKPGPAKASLAADDPNVQQIAFYVKRGDRTWDEVMADARAAIGRPTPAPAQVSLAPPTGRRSLASIFRNARPPAAETAAPPSEPSQVPPTEER